MFVLVLFIQVQEMQVWERIDHKNDVGFVNVRAIVGGDA